MLKGPVAGGIRYACKECCKDVSDAVRVAGLNIVIQRVDINTSAGNGCRCVDRHQTLQKAVLNLLVRKAEGVAFSALIIIQNGQIAGLIEQRGEVRVIGTVIGEGGCVGIQGAVCELLNLKTRCPDPPDQECGCAGGEPVSAEVFIRKGIEKTEGIVDT